jgi:hypothetical protein
MHDRKYPEIIKDLRANSIVSFQKYRRSLKISNPNNEDEYVGHLSNADASRSWTYDKPGKPGASGCLLGQIIAKSAEMIATRLLRRIQKPTEWSDRTGHGKKG